MKPATLLSLRQLSWCLALAVAMLFTQFVGQRHRIDHTPWPSAEMSGVSAKAAWADATHSCIALDAAALAYGVCPDLTRLAPASVDATTWRSAAHLHDLRFATSYHSRAPPAYS